MRICVFGAGAIGGHLAVRLARGGAEVSVVARGAQAEAIAERGLTVHAPDGVLTARPRIGSPAQLGPQDAVLVTTKQTALPAVAADIGPLLGPETAVAFVMNGIPWWYFDGTDQAGRRIEALDPGGALRERIGIARTLGGVIWSACTVTAPGVIAVNSRSSRLLIGEPDGRLTRRAEALVQAVAAGGMAAKAVSDIRLEIWTKLIGNLATGPLCLLSRRSIRETLAEPVLRRAAITMMEEAIAIARALGVQVPTGAAERIAASHDTPHKPSIPQDLEAGRPMEIDALFRIPLALGAEAGVAAPLLALTTTLARQAAEAAGLYPPR
ncbi:MAG: 2-dehydropantoate 2-reductase [Rhodovarius sp.]|nr:2-dehydropantoate 2-reductase [Rhodovarius sp.]